MEKICDIAEAIMNITDNDIKETQEMIDGQRRYNNPLRIATTARQHMLCLTLVWGLHLTMQYVQMT